MPRIKLEEMLDGISNYLIERGHAKSKEDIKYEWQNSIEFPGIRKGQINAKDKNKQIDFGIFMKVLKKATQTSST